MKQRKYYAVWYRRVQDQLEYSLEARRDLSLANVVAFTSKRKRDEWVEDEGSAYHLRCSAKLASYYLYGHLENAEVIA